MLSERTLDGITVNRDADGTPREVRYLTDDRDSRRPMELVIGWGNNGDWYIYTAPEREHSVSAVRLCTSGGISSRVPGVNPLIAQIFRLLTNTRATNGAAIAPQTCVLCGHRKVDNGPCIAHVPICSDDYHGMAYCGCKCVFPAHAEQVDAVTAERERCAGIAETYAADVARRFEGTEMPVDHSAALEIANTIRKGDRK